MASTPYITLATFMSNTLLSRDDVLTVESISGNFTANRIAIWQAQIDARLNKRYAVPFATVPEIVLGWLVALVSLDVLIKRGYANSDEKFVEQIEVGAKTALDQITEAANSQTGLFDLPLVDGQPGSAITQGGPMGYAETSPYSWTDVQARNGVADDLRQGGS